jgi:hypothetical protein
VAPHFLAKTTHILPPPISVKPQVPGTLPSINSPVPAWREGQPVLRPAWVAVQFTLNELQQDALFQKAKTTTFN